MMLLIELHVSYYGFPIIKIITGKEVVKSMYKITINDYILGVTMKIYHI